MNIKYQIFVSSTYQDLAEERNIAINTILDMGHFPVASEMFPASNRDTLTYIKAMIDSSDYFLLIIGDRYGTISQNGISFTEEEYNYALMKNKKILIMCKAGNEDAQIDSKLNDFINKVKERHTLCFWKEPHDFQIRLSSCLYNLFENDKAETYWIKNTDIKKGFKPNKSKNSVKMDEELDNYFTEIKDIMGINNAKLEDANIIGLMAMNLAEIRQFYILTKNQAISSYVFAKNTSIVGILFVILSIVISLIFDKNDIAFVTGISGAIIEVLAGTSLFIYKKSQNQLNYYYSSLHNNERFLSLINISSKTKNRDVLYADIIHSELENLKMYGNKDKID